MILIDGRKVAEEIKNELKEKIRDLKEKNGKVPGLVTILVGEDPASKIYINSKGKACTELGMLSRIERLSGNIPERDLLDLVTKYNNDPDYHGILVQTPLPAHINQDKVMETISPKKDVDGFHPISVGNLVIGKDTFYPCTPYGIMVLLQRYNIQTKGKHVVVVGRSNIVGKPIANMMLQKKEGANSIVTICHSAAADLSRYTRDADILIAAIGRPKFIKADMVKEGVVLLDVGINRVEDSTSSKGYKVIGDVDFENVAPKSSYITPVPGGVGAMTIAMLMQNTFNAFLKIEHV